jgi:hypothetical protein
MADAYGNQGDARSAAQMRAGRDARTSEYETAKASIDNSPTILLAKAGDSFNELVEKFNIMAHQFAKAMGVEARNATVAQYHGVIARTLADAQARDAEAVAVPVLAPVPEKPFGFETTRADDGTAAEPTPAGTFDTHVVRGK